MKKLILLIVWSVFIGCEATDRENESRRITTTHDSLIFKYIYKNNDSEIIKNGYRQDPFIVFEKDTERNSLYLMFYKLGYHAGDSEVVIDYIYLDTANNKIYKDNPTTNNIIEWHQSMP